MHRTTIAALGAFVLAVPTVALSNETNLGNPVFSTAASQQGSTDPTSAEIVGPKMSGSAAVYDIEKLSATQLCVCLATADHVMKPNDNWKVFLHDGGNGFITLDSTKVFSTYKARGKGAFTLAEDMGWLGFRVNKNQVDDATWNGLLAIKPKVNDLLTSAPPKKDDTIQHFGFGRSANYLVGDTLIAKKTTTFLSLDTFTPGNQGNGHFFTASGFAWTAGDAGIQFGKADRFTSTIVSSLGKQASIAYEFEGEQSIIKSTVGTGALGDGDSGGAVKQGSNLIGLNTNEDFTRKFKLADGTESDIVGYDKYKETSLLFTKADVKFLNDQCASLGVVPEPGEHGGPGIFSTCCIAASKGALGRFLEVPKGASSRIHFFPNSTWVGGDA